MKKLLLTVLIMLFTFAPMTQAQNNQRNQQIVVDARDLPPAVLDEINKKKATKEIENKIEMYGKYAGMGKEVGIGIREGLTAVKDVSIEFSESDLGFFTMAMIGWNIIGFDLVRIAMGILVILFGFIFVMRSYFKTCTETRVYIEGRQPLLMRPFKSSGEYRIVDPLYPEGGGAIFHLLALAGMIGLAAAVMFA